MQENKKENVFSVDKVKEEITAGDDELANWVMSKQASQFFLPTDSNTVAEFSAISDWSQNYEQSAIHTFMRAADYYLVAHAKQRNAIVVTNEIPSNSKRKIKIPDVCMDLNIEFVNPFKMLRQSGAKFVL